MDKDDFVDSLAYSHQYIISTKQHPEYYSFTISKDEAQSFFVSINKAAQKEQLEDKLKDLLSNWQEKDSFEEITKLQSRIDGTLTFWRVALPDSMYITQIIEDYNSCILEWLLWESI